METGVPTMKIIKDGIVEENLDSIKTVSYIAKSVNNPFRQKILGLLLANNKLAVFELCEKLQTEQSVVSQHLAILRKAKLVQAQREGKVVYYSVNEAYLQELIDSIIFLTRHFKK